METSSCFGFRALSRAGAFARVNVIDSFRRRSCLSPCEDKRSLPVFPRRGAKQKGDFVSGDSPLVYLIFLIGTPPNAIAEYLGFVAWLAGRVRDLETRQHLLVVETPEAFLKIVTAAAS